MKFVFPSVSLLLLCSCNLNQNVAIRGLDLHTHSANGDTFVDFESIISLGNLKLANTSTPIKNSDQREIGEVTIQQLDDGTSRVAATINYDEVNKVDTSLGKTLPNGREIPAVLKSDSTLIGFPILTNSRVYVGGNTKENLYAGIALNIPAYDHILNRVPTPLNLFLAFPFSEVVLGTAGIYSNPNKTQNGIAIFAKKSQQQAITRAHSPGSSTLDQLNELSKVDHLTLFRLNYLFSKHAILRIQ